MRKPEAKVEHPPEVARRLFWLERLIDEKYDGKAAVLEAKAGVTMSQVGQWFSGNRMLREKALATLQAKTGKPDGWFDRPIPGEVSNAGTESPPSMLVPKNPGTRYLVTLLGEKLRSLDSLDRDQAKVILSALASSPEDAPSLATKLERLLGEPPGDQEEANSQGVQ